MAPEMVRASLAELDARTDVYLLGATLFAMLTGRPRHAGKTLVEVLYAAMTSDPPELGSDVPDALRSLVVRATHVQPDERPPSARAFRDELASFLRHRASLRLSDEASRLLWSADDPSASSEARSALLAEARLGFGMALREWPESEAARSGLRGTLHRLCELDLARQNLEGARDLAGRLEPRDAELDARVEALARTLTERRRLEDVGRAESHDRDRGVAASQRLAVTLGLLGCAGLVFAVLAVSLWETGEPPSTQTVGLLDAATFGLVVLVTLLLRRRLFSTRWSRTAVSFVVFSVGVRLVTDVVAIARGDGIMEHGPYALVAISVGVGAFAFSLTPRLHITAALGVLGAVASCFVPVLGVPTMFAVVFGTAGILLTEDRRGT
jgi:hypothetical protein